VAGATFECRLDKRPPAPCVSPISYRVRPGAHTFTVFALSAAGADPTPASFGFKVKRKATR
jgi:hypothetical protein